MPPPVSIIIPCLDGARTLSQAIASCAHQGPVEIILADNGSEDDSVAVATTAARRHGLELRVVREPHRGVNRVRRAGFEAARGAYIQLLDADDTLARGKIPAQVEALERHPQADIAYGDWVWVEHAASPWTVAGLRRLRLAHQAAAYGSPHWFAYKDAPRLALRPFRLAPWPDFLTRLLEDKWLPPHAYLQRRRAAARLHERAAFWPGQQYVSDREYFLVAALLGMEFVYAPGSLVHYHGWSGLQMTRSYTMSQRSDALATIYGRLRAVARHPDAVELTADQRFLLELDWSLYQGSAAATPAGAGDEDGELAAVARLVATMTGPLNLERYAKLAAFTIPTLWERHTAALRVLHRLVACGALRRVSP